MDQAASVYPDLDELFGEAALSWGSPAATQDTFNFGDEPGHGHLTLPSRGANETLHAQVDALFPQGITTHATGGVPESPFPTYAPPSTTFPVGTTRTTRQQSTRPPQIGNINVANPFAPNDPPIQTPQWMGAYNGYSAAGQGGFDVAAPYQETNMRPVPFTQPFHAASGNMPTYSYGYSAAPTAMGPPALARPPMASGTQYPPPRGFGHQPPAPMVRQQVASRGQKGREAYDAPPLSRAWGKLSNTRGNQAKQFVYSDKGVELRMDLSLEREDMLLFMTQDPPRGFKSPDRRRLTLWIQNAPFNCNTRYHHGTSSSKCRYRHCPDDRRTILKGFWRIAFDERSPEGLDLSGTPSTEDPYLNAGYMHLYCFEELFDLALLMKQMDDIDANASFGVAPLTVLPDNRDFPHETNYRNSMALTRDHKALLDVFEDWKSEQYQKLATQARTPTTFGDVKARKRKKTDMLWYRLTDAHLRLQVPGRAETRKQRNGADISKHKGDLRKFLGMREENKQRDKSERDNEGADDMTDLGPPETPFVQIQHMASQLKAQPRTRKRSAAAANLVEEASHVRVTRHMSSLLQPLILGEPPHVQRRLQSILVQDQASPPKGGGSYSSRSGQLRAERERKRELFHASERERLRLKEKVDALPAAKKRALDKYVAKLDAKDGLVRRYNSLGG